LGRFFPTSLVGVVKGCQLLEQLSLHRVSRSLLGIVFHMGFTFAKISFDLLDTFSHVRGKLTLGATLHPNVDCDCLFWAFHVNDMSLFCGCVL
jgi:fucose permease